MPGRTVDEALDTAELSRLAARLAVRPPVEAIVGEHSAVDAGREPRRQAAVAAVLRAIDGSAELLFIKRAEIDGDPWSGHMAFPGGRRDAADATLEATAIRETREELGLDLSVGRLLGQLDDLAPATRNLPPVVIRPFVAVVPADVVLVPNAEVAATFWVPVDRLRSDDAQAEHVMTINGARARFPGYRVHEHIVWGLTERIVRQLLPLLAL